jgi:hypothetical protein
MNRADRHVPERTPLVWHVLAALAVLLSWLGIGGLALLGR